MALTNYFLELTNPKQNQLVSWLLSAENFTVGMLFLVTFGDILSLIGHLID